MKIILQGVIAVISMIILNGVITQTYPISLAICVGLGVAVVSDLLELIIKNAIKGARDE